MKKKLLVTGLYYSEKTSTYYVQGYFYDAKKNNWVGQYNSKTKSWGTHNIACTQEEYAEITSKIADGVIVDVEVTGFTATSFPIYSLV